MPPSATLNAPDTPPRTPPSFANEHQSANNNLRTTICEQQSANITLPPTLCYQPLVSHGSRSPSPSLSGAPAAQLPRHRRCRLQTVLTPLLALRSVRQVFTRHPAHVPSATSRLFRKLTVYRPLLLMILVALCSAVSGCITWEKRGTDLLSAVDEAKSAPPPTGNFNRKRVVLKLSFESSKQGNFKSRENHATVPLFGNGSMRPASPPAFGKTCCRMVSALE